MEINVIGTGNQGPFSKLADNIGGYTIKVLKFVSALFILAVYFVGVPAAVIKIIFYM